MSIKFLVAASLIAIALLAVLGWKYQTNSIPAPVIASTGPADIQRVNRQTPNGDQNSTESGPDLSRQISELRAEVAKLAKIVQKKEQPTETFPVENNGQIVLPSAPTAEQTAELDRLIEDQAQNASDQLLAFREALESNFAEENADPGWAADKANALKAAISALPPPKSGNFDMRALECKSTTCRLEMEFDSSEARTSFEMPMAFSIAKQLPVMSLVEENIGNSVRVTYFLKGSPGPSS